MDVFEGRWTAARTLVYSGSLRAFDVIIKAGQAQGDLHPSAKKLAVATVRRQGTLADAVLTGTLCSARQCVSNSKTKDPSPIFVVHLRHAAGKWAVWFPVPTAVK